MTSSNSQSRAAVLTLVGGALALDFANTASGRGTAQPLDHLQRLDDLFGWAAHAGMNLPPERVAQASGGPVPLEAALALREAIYRTGAALAAGGAPRADDLAHLRDAAADATALAELRRDGTGRYAWQFGADAPAAAHLVGRIALSAVDMLQNTDFSRLKQCPGADCGWLFIDRSKNNSRRWCLMSVCGNRTKARRFQGRV